MMRKRIAILLTAICFTAIAQPAEDKENGRWYLTGSDRANYTFGVDPNIQREGRHPAFVRARNASARGPAIVAQEVDAANLRGKEITLNAYVRTQQAGAARLWVRVDGADKRTLATAEAQQEPLTGTTDWQPQSVTVAVPGDAVELAFGVALTGAGTAWLDNAELHATPEAVAAPVATPGADMAVAPSEPAEPAVAAALDEAAATAGMAASRIELDGDWELRGLNPGDYEHGVDETVTIEREPARFLFSKQPGPRDNGTSMRRLEADPYRGARLKLSAHVKTAAVQGWAGLWLRVDGEDDRVLAFDNMESRPIRGDQEWQRYEVVLDVPQDAEQLAYGLVLNGRGKVWFGDVALETVPAEVPVTAPVRSAPAE